MSYISELQIDNGSVIPIGSSLYGVCDSTVDTYAKIVTLTNFDTLINGVTIHVKFTNGNSAPLVNPSNGTEYLTLKVGSTNAQQITNPGGSINWSAGAVISFTYDGTGSTWIVNDSDSGQQITISNTYSATSTNAISGQGVADALDDLGAAAQKGVITSITTANTASADLPTTNAVVSYINGRTAGLTGAMHFKGSVGSVPPATGTYEAGDVVLLSSTNKEYVYDGTNWILLGDEGSYALKTNTATVIKSTTFTQNTLPTLTITAVTIPNVTNAGSAPTLTTTAVSIPNVTNVGSAADFEVSQGVLRITKGAAPTLGTDISVQEVESWDAGSATTLGTAISVGSASGWNAGSQASLTTDDQTVVVP